MNIITIARKRALRAVPHSVRTEASECQLANPVAREAAQDGHPIAFLLRLREEAANEIDRLLAFLDATEGDLDADDDDDREQDCEDEGAHCDDEGALA